jgi:L,D-peptidoglycan transpeptidase YkuD (ErfK/YbiS/YcfS/YnhG family)
MDGGSKKVNELVAKGRAFTVQALKSINPETKRAAFELVKLDDRSKRIARREKELKIRPMHSHRAFFMLAVRDLFAVVGKNGRFLRKGESTAAVPNFQERLAAANQIALHRLKVLSDIRHGRRKPDGTWKGKRRRRK